MLKKIFIILLSFNLIFGQNLNTPIKKQKDIFTNIFDDKILKIIDLDNLKLIKTIKNKDKITYFTNEGYINKNIFSNLSKKHKKYLSLSKNNHIIKLININKLKSIKQFIKNKQNWHLTNVGYIRNDVFKYISTYIETISSNTNYLSYGGGLAGLGLLIGGLASGSGSSSSSPKKINTYLSLYGSSMVNEGSNITYTVTISNPPTSDLIINLTNGETITIPAGSTNNSILVNIPNNIYINNNLNITNSILNIIGGSEFSNLIIDYSNITTTIVNNTTTTNLSLEATPNINEGSNITYTATISNPPTSDLIVNLTNGEIITILAGSITGSTTITTTNDVYINNTISNSILNIVGGSEFENLYIDTSIINTTINDDIDLTTITIEAPTSIITESNITYTAIVSNPPRNSDLVITLSNGETITIPVGSTNGTLDSISDFVTENTIETITIAYASGGNFEALDTTHSFDLEIILTPTNNNNPDYTIGTPSTNVILIKDQEYNRSTYLSGVNAISAYKEGWTGKGVNVAILDTGIDVDHEDLVDGITETYDETNTSVQDRNGHGSNVASIIGARNNDIGYLGVAYESNLISVKVLDDSGSGTYNWTANGIVTATDANAKISNLSLGSTGATINEVNTLLPSVRYALQNDNTLIFAAGNDSLSCKVLNNGINDCGFPATLPLIEGSSDLVDGTYDGAFVVVGAVENDTLNISDFSNRAGDTKEWFIVAPGGGGGTYSGGAFHDGTYIGYAGTSQAAPVVSGAFALMAQKYPYLTGSQIRDIYFATATDLGVTGVDDVYGHGLINIEDAMAPIGEITIPQGGFVYSPNTTYTLNGSTMNVSSAFNVQNISSKLSSIIGIDEYNKNYNFDISNNITTNKPFSFEDFQFIPFNSKYSIGINDKQQYGLRLKINDNFYLINSFDNSFLGTEGKGALELNKTKTIYSELNYSNNEFNIGLLYGIGNAKGSGLIQNIDKAHAIGGKISYKINKNFKLGLEVPLRVLSGKMQLNKPTSISSNGSLNSTISNISLKPNGFERTIFGEYNIQLSEDQLFNVNFGFTQDFNNFNNSNESKISFKYSKIFDFSL